MTNIYRTYQMINDEIKYTEDYTIGIGEDFETYEDMIAALDELIGEAYDSYTVEPIND